MQVYRIEKLITINNQSIMVGPWLAAVYDPSLENDTWEWKLSLHRFPEPKEDGIQLKPNMIFGLADAFHLDTWLNLRGWEALQRSHFLINEYIVPDKKIHLGRTQVGYYAADATLVGNIEYIDLYKRLDDIYFNRI
jgi:hypothetical protein